MITYAPRNPRRVTSASVVFDANRLSDGEENDEDGTRRWSCHRNCHPLEEIQQQKLLLHIYIYSGGVWYFTSGVKPAHFYTATVFARLTLKRCFLQKLNHGPITIRYHSMLRKYYHLHLAGWRSAACLKILQRFTLSGIPTQPQEDLLFSRAGKILVTVVSDVHGRRCRSPYL
ncbi:hypothetical protein EVAR_50918_1 [Eumeta japonica]|uniref:Uncharacterized protein n=1 Tax=Eumeta variegata TaxID=151549 RepID=A0A4C1Y6B4_EUMVA|nr:hypothetical protein EVAR_50918_1 [Eumeta japonica]